MYIRFSLFAVCMAAVLACAPPAEHVAQYGSLRVRLPDTPRSLTFAQAEANANFYEVVAYNDGIITSVTSSPGEPAELVMSLPAGSYTVVVLAGVNDYSRYCLLGTGMVEGVAVVADAVTTTDVAVSNVSFTLEAPALVTCGEAFDISATGDAGVDVIRVSESSSATYVELGEDPTNQNMSIELDAGTWTGSVSVIAPTHPGTATIRFYGPSLRLVDESVGVDTYLRNLGREWEWLDYASLPSESPLLTEASVQTEFQTASTGIQVDVRWEQR